VMIFVIFVGYAISGPLWWVVKFIRKISTKDGKTGGASRTE